MPTMRRSDDWRLEWGRAELESALGIFLPGQDRKAAMARFLHAVELNPENRELRSRAAIALSRQVTFFSRSDEANVLQGGRPSKPGEQPKLPDPEKVAAALTALGQAEQLDPDNGALDYFTAIVLFAAHRDDEANEALRRFGTKPRWDFYDLQAARVAASAGRRAGWPRYYAVMRGSGCAGGVSFRMNVRRVIKWLSAWARLFEERGQHEKAIERYRLCFLIGQRLRENAQVPIDLIVANPVTGATAWAAAMRRVNEDELAAVAHSNSPGGQKTVSHDLLEEVELERFYSYLSAHGAGDLALRVRADLSATRSSRDDLRRVFREREQWPSFLNSVRMGLAAEAQALILPCLLALGILALLSWRGEKALRRPKVKAQGALFLVVLVLGAAASAVWWRTLVIGLPLLLLLLVAGWIWAILSRRRRACVKGRHWFLLEWLANVNVSSLWTIAVLLTLFLLLFIPIAIYGARLEHYYQDVLARGKLAVLLGH